MVLIGDYHFLKCISYIIINPVPIGKNFKKNTRKYSVQRVKQRIQGKVCGCLTIKSLHGGEKVNFKISLHAVIMQSQQGIRRSNFMSSLQRVKQNFLPRHRSSSVG